MNFNIKTYLIAGAVTAVAGVSFIIYILFGGGQTTSDKLILRYDKEEIEVNNFVAGAENIANTIYLAKTPSYSIVFSLSDSNFAITLMESNKQTLETARTNAEQQLISKLGIDKTKVCRLPVSVVVPYDYNQQYSTEDFGLSFCPSGKAFPPEVPQAEYLPDEEPEGYMLEGENIIQSPETAIPSKSTESPAPWDGENVR